MTLDKYNELVRLVGELNENRTPLSKRNYLPYLASDIWHFRTIGYKIAHDNTCQRCHKQFEKNLCLHHRSYKNLGCEELNDVILYCRNCHAKVEAKLENGDIEHYPNIERPPDTNTIDNW